MRLIKILLLTGVLAAAVLAWRFNAFIHSPVPEQPDHLLTVTKGESAHSVLQRLVALNIEQRFYLKLWGWWQPQLMAIKSGTYDTSSRPDLTALLQLLESGKEKLFSITLVEGLRWQDWWQQIQQHPHIDSARFDPEVFIKAQNLPGQSLEGWLMPDTYYFPAAQPAEKVIEQAYLKMQGFLADEWLERQGQLPLTTPYDALILASIIEKETAVASERPLIAGVFVNRLLQNMRLQTDPTVIYGLGARFDGNLTRADLREATPYNTYKISGLPPTPIAMASAESIRAALHPQATDALYFVARGDGTHQFSATLGEHNAAVKQYQLKQD